MAGRSTKFGDVTQLVKGVFFLQPQSIDTGFRVGYQRLRESEVTTLRYYISIPYSLPNVMLDRKTETLKIKDFEKKSFISVFYRVMTTCQEKLLFPTKSEYEGERCELLRMYVHRMLIYLLYIHVDQPVTLW